VSGTAETYVTTTHGAATWRAAQVPGAGTLDFRRVWAFDAKTAYLLSIATADQSPIYRTSDAGSHWKRWDTMEHSRNLLRNPEELVIGGRAPSTWKGEDSAK
jgi:photosystem II stability/assembly factor-like uncharacterized protein